ncbi:MAG: hypothetical protein IPJ82_22185 [Lewinellaceae bacterium]|nr:hypothetical protein [Lewinellaceae bacterium]
MRFFLFFLFFGLLTANLAQAQSARLGVQGILKKANGNAVDDGTYSITFKLYDMATGGTALWTETQTNVELASGIYTATLGSVTALNIPFDKTYYLGITVGTGAEMSPRIQLTTAPYALSLIGNTNQFPSSGLVKADSGNIAGRLAVGQALSGPHSVQVNGGILARGGAPGTGGANNNGYAFSGNSGDKDSGLFSNGDGQVSIHTNNTERLLANTTGVQVTGTLGATGALNIGGNLTATGTTVTVDDNLNLTTGKSLQYNTLNDWRLVDRDDFTGPSQDGWSGTGAINNSTVATIENFTVGTFNGPGIRPSTSNANCLKKTFNLSGAGSYTYVKVKFKYYYIDSWDADDTGIGGFCTDLSGTNANICWMNSAYVYSTSGLANYTGDAGYSDGASIGEMIAFTSSSSFTVFFGMRGDSGTGGERYGISNIEVWVR